MSSTNVAELAAQAREYWAPQMVKELKEETLLMSLVNRDYEGQILKGGDTVRVSQIQVPQGLRKQVGSGHEVFSPDKLVTTQVAVVADQVISASFELDSLVDLQTQLGDPSGQSSIRDALTKSIEIQINNYLYSLVAPSTSAPDHLINGVSDFNATQLTAVRTLASAAKWPNDGNWYALLAPQYYSDILNATTLTSGDYAPDRPTVGGRFMLDRWGFKIVEDNSDGISNMPVQTAGTLDAGLIFHKDFMLAVMQNGLTFDIAPLTSNKQFGYVVVAKVVMGAKLGLEGNVKHIQVYNS